jgi:hypothetical protein
MVSRTSAGKCLRFRFSSGSSVISYYEYVRLPEAGRLRATDDWDLTTRGFRFFLRFLAAITILLMNVMRH